MRIAQITDLHLRYHLPGTAASNKRRSREIPQLLGQALQAVKQQNVDLLVVTGDLLDAPLWLWESTYGFETDDPAHWLPAMEQDYRLVKRMLDDSGLRYMVLPGNHDMDELMWRVFDPSENILDITGHRVVRFCDREANNHFARRFTAQRKRFNSLLVDSASPPQVHLQHYVVHPALNQSYPHTYLEGEELTRRMSQSGKVRLSLSGHYHTGTDLLTVGDTVFATGKAFCDAPHHWQVYDLTGPSIQREAYTVLPEPTQRTPVFLDRDGVINDLASYHTGPEDMRLIPGVAAAIGRLNQAGLPVVGITSQSCVGCGYVSEEVVVAVHDKMHRLLAQGGGYLDAMYYSTGTGDLAVLPKYADTSKAKPQPFNLHQAREHLHLDLTHAWMVGDRFTDIQTAWNAGVRPILVRTGDGRITEAKRQAELQNVPIVDDLAAAVDLILAAQP